ncbi:MAG: 50S ribosomal protein L25 [Parcubacteria group bacterium GW2011_GWA1_42_7]|nr:MAG: 50S ribosomal protein L25 [Parcubacteria group bacterium GW2011_GWB1_42_6]KKS70111.1 MAG: 50S ribosomal protein L25 [Parcubacteria group bacterium GW2011_GWA1_42_7]KKS92476.1 MAG: 50S ribosomal protein L25/general stress protein Ctc, large subunit ribosomal protein L25 [Parcubacteria group bacterium GW2011_GWC1_43_12]
MTELKAESRKIAGKKNNQLRRTGQIPAVLYGHGIESQSVSVNSRDFKKSLSEAGETTILILDLDGKKHNVLIHDLSKDILTGETTHVDFYEVRMDEKIKTKIPLVFIGESLAVKSEGGVLVHALQELEIEAFPQDLPKNIEVDISALKTFEDKIKVESLRLPDSVKILNGPEETIVLAVPPRSESELAELDTVSAEEQVGEIKVAGKEETAEEAPVEEGSEK